jgi:microcystin-dependent protein
MTVIACSSTRSACPKLQGRAPAGRLRRHQQSIADVNATRSEVSQYRLVARIIYRIEAIRIDTAAKTTVTEMTAAEMAASKMAAAEVAASEMSTTKMATTEVTAAKCEGGGKERSDCDESKSEFAKHF